MKMAWTIKKFSQRMVDGLNDIQNVALWTSHSNFTKLGSLKRTSDLAEDLRKLVAGDLLGYSDNVTKTSLSPSVKKRTTLGSRLRLAIGTTPATTSQHEWGSRLSRCHEKQKERK